MGEGTFNENRRIFFKSNGGNWREFDGIKEVTFVEKVVPTRVIFRDPATIVFWSDGTKTVVKTMNGTEFDPYVGFCVAVTKKHFGSNCAIKSFIENNSDTQVDSKYKVVSEYAGDAIQRICDLDAIRKLYEVLGIKDDGK